MNVQTAGSGEVASPQRILRIAGEPAGWLASPHQSHAKNPPARLSPPFIGTLRMKRAKVRIEALPPVQSHVPGLFDRLLAHSITGHRPWRWRLARDGLTKMDPRSAEVQGRLAIAHRLHTASGILNFCSAHESKSSSASGRPEHVCGQSKELSHVSKACKVRYPMSTMEERARRRTPYPTPKSHGARVWNHGCNGGHATLFP